MDRLSISFERKMRAEITRASKRMVDVWLLTGDVPADAMHREKVEALYVEMAEKVLPAFGDRVGRKRMSGPSERKDFFSTMMNAARAYVAGEAIRRRIVNVSETTRALIVQGVEAGRAEGLGQSGIGKQIRSLVPRLSRQRANMIARTETHGAAQSGADMAARELGVEFKREWMAANDKDPDGNPRTRESHREADGQIVGKDEPFIVGGAALMFPGDPSGPPSETINCRCVVGFVVED